MNNKTQKKILLIGWDGADWKVIHSLMDAGKMPNLEKFVNQGVAGNLASLYPSYTPMLWTSIATGKRPYKHGIMGFVEPDPVRGGIRPITMLSRKTKAIWNILNQTGMKCNVIGWWPSHPAEPINGVMVSNLYQRAEAPFEAPWPMKPGTVHPQRLIENIKALRLHPKQLQKELVLNFVPHISEIDPDKDKRIVGLFKIIADCTTISRAATAVMHHEQWDFTAVYFDAIDHFSHGYMTLHPPRLPWVPEKDFRLYNKVVESGYIYHDILLGLLLKQAGEDTSVIIVSDHGFHSDHLRPKHLPVESAGPAAQHRHFGILAMKGPGIKKDELIYGANLLDICPTILTMLGLPVGEDMDGKPLINAFEKPPVIEVIPSWDNVQGDDGSHPPDLQLDPVDSQEAINQLVELGYIDQPDDDTKEAEKEAVYDLRFNLARSYMDANLHTDAIKVLEDLVKESPDESRFGVQLAVCYHKVGKTIEARPVIKELLKRRRENQKKAKKELKEFLKGHKDTKPEDFTKKDKVKYRKLRGESISRPQALEFLMGQLLFDEGDYKKALNRLKNVEKSDTPGQTVSRPDLYNKLGDVYLKMKLWEEAQRSFKKALEIDPENPAAHTGLSRSLLSLKKNRSAAESALDSVGLQYHNPMGHYLLGVALHRTGRIYQAVDALNVAVSQNPNFPEAHKRLAHIHKSRLKDHESALKHEDLAEEAKKRLKDIKKGKISSSFDKKTRAEISSTSDQALASATHLAVTDEPFDLENTAIIVSGLPRSGTSMMMQMIASGGLPALTDGKRRADEDNLRGYYEYEKVKGLSKKSSWLPEAKGRSIKVVAQLLKNLPVIRDLKYRVIFMERPLNEVLPSQRTMLKRTGKGKAGLSDDRLKQVFSAQVKQTKLMLSARKVPTVFLNYNDVLKDPLRSASVINKFLGDRLDEHKMADAVVPEMKRQKGD